MFYWKWRFYIVGGNIGIFYKKVSYIIIIKVIKIRKKVKNREINLCLDKWIFL